MLLCPSTGTSPPILVTRIRSFCRFRSRVAWFRIIRCCILGRVRGRRWRGFEGVLLDTKNEGVTLESQTRTRPEGDCKRRLKLPCQEIQAEQRKYHQRYGMGLRECKKFQSSSVKMLPLIQNVMGMNWWQTAPTLGASSSHRSLHVNLKVGEMEIGDYEGDCA